MLAVLRALSNDALSLTPLTLPKSCCYGGTCCVFFFFQAEDGIRDLTVTGVQTCALPISNAIRRDRRPKKSSHTTNSSTIRVAAALKAWNECGHCCTYQPSQVGSGPFS